MSINLFSLCSISDSKRLLRKVLEADKEFIIKEYRKYKPRIPRGFTPRSLGSIPNNLLLDDLIEKAMFPDLYKTIMKVWFESHTDLFSVVSEALKINGYEIITFSMDKFGSYCKKLLDKDIKSEDDKSYFAPNGSYIEGYDKLDVTIMALLLGWCFYDEEEIPDTIEVEKEVETTGSSYTENENDKNINVKDDFTSNNRKDKSPEENILIKDTPKDNAHDSISNSEKRQVEEDNTLKNNLTDIDKIKSETPGYEQTPVPQLIDIYNDNIRKFYTYKNNSIKLFQEAIVILNNDDIQKFDNLLYNIDVINSIKLGFSSILNIQNIIFIRIKHIIYELNSCIPFSINSEINAKKIDDVVLFEIIDSYKNQVRLSVENLLTDISTSSAKLNQSEQDDIKLMVDNLNIEIDNDNFYFDAQELKILYNKLLEIKSYIAEIDDDQKLFKACENYLNYHTYSSLVIIYENIRKSGTPFDLLLFLFAASQDEQSRESYAELLKKNQDDILRLLLSFIEADISFVKKIIYNQILFSESLNDKGGIVYFLLNIMLYISTKDELAESNLWNLVETMEKYPALLELNNMILQKNYEGFYKYKYNNSICIKSIEEFFSKDKGVYSRAKNNDRYTREFLTGILDVLNQDFINFKNIKDIDQIEKILDKIKSNDYQKETLNEAIRKFDKISAHEEIKYRAEGRKTIEHFVDVYLPFINSKIEIIINYGKISGDDIISDLNKISIIYNDLNKIINTIIQLINGEIVIKESSHELYDTIVGYILTSEFMALNFPSFCSKISSVNIDPKQLLNDIFICVVENPSPQESAEILISQNNFSNSELLIKKYGLIIDYYETQKNELNNIVDNYIAELKELNIAIPEEYRIDENNFRYSFAVAGLRELINKTKREMAVSKEKVANEMENLLKDVADIKIRISAERENYSSDKTELLFKGITNVEFICLAKRTDKIDIARKITDEISYLLINSDSFVKLKELVGGGEIEELKLSDDSIYLRLSFQEILNKMEHEDYIGLGINYNDWNNFTDTRKINIKNLISNYLFLLNKPVIREEANRTGKQKEIQEALLEISKSLGEICSLYITNDNDRVSVDPFNSYNIDPKIPFVFRTKIIRPKCEPLNQIINIYFVTDLMLDNNAYISSLKNYFFKDPIDSYKMIFLIGDRKKLNKRISHTELKDIPVIDETELKSIFFSSELKKNPKWKFTYLLIQSENISDIQPFKSESLVRSDNNIFVGRDSIISKMLRNPTNTAYYGGRRIGKTSLLTELNFRFNEKTGYKSIYCSLQGNNALQSANLIKKNLDKVFGLTGNVSINSLDDFKNILMDYFFKFPDLKLIFLIDEIDTLIKLEREIGITKHHIIEIFRSVSQDTGNNFMFIFAGFKGMYKEIKRKDSVYSDGTDTPWSNFVEQTATHLKPIDTPEGLVNEGLRDILGLEYDDEVSKSIVNYSSGHPAFLQKFCQCLVLNRLKNKINRNYRHVTIEDVNHVFQKDREFLDFVVNTIDGNLSEYQRLMVYIAANTKEDINKFTVDFFKAEINDWLTLKEIKLDLDVDQLNLELELLEITGVVISNENGYSFAHRYYRELLRRIIGDKSHRDIISKLIDNVFINGNNQNYVQKEQN